jgi:hypothetical protein
MKLQIDSKAKTIKLDEKVNLGELFKFLSKLMPKDSPLGDWKTYTLDAGNVTINNWGQPVVIDRWRTPSWHNPFYVGDGITIGTPMLNDFTVKCSDTNSGSYSDVSLYKTTFDKNIPSTLTTFNFELTN